MSLPPSSPPQSKRTFLMNYRFHDNVRLGKRVKNPIEYKGRHLKLTKPFQGPAQFSLKDKVDHIYDQGSLGACVAHSMVEALKLICKVKNEKLSWYQSAKPKFSPSRLFIYWNARVIDEDPLSEDSGCTNLSACLAMAEYKTTDEDLWPYHVERFNKAPPGKVFTAAHKHQLFDYSKLERSIEAFKHSLYEGYPIMAGLVVHSSFMKAPQGDVPMPQGSKDRIEGGHSILIIGYDDETKRFIFQNHWSSSWGSDGFGTVPYEYIMEEDLSGDFFSIHHFE